MSNLEKIQNELLSLSADERELISIFLKNAESKMDAGYHETWQDEMNRRLSEMQNGNANLVSSSYAVSEIRNKLAK